jgi:HAE1 family hydrophobic/amphiphilic exporter-1
VKNLLPTFRSEIPASVKMDILYDRSDTIRESYKDVQFTMLLTLGLVVMVIFLFLRNVSATVIPALALPFSIIGTFAIMYLLHYSLDNLSMMALILSVGFVVDDAIVMLENIFRHMEMGEKPLYAALAGSKEIGFTIVSMTLSLAAVFIPVLFLGGILGRLFREFAVTICVAILISGIVSVTLTPMLCSRFLRSPEEQKRSWFYRTTERFFEALLRVYDYTLQIVLRHRGLTMAASLLVLAGTVIMFIKIPKGFIPDQDTDQVYAVTEAAQGTSYYQMVDYQKRVAEVFRTNPDVQALMSTVGGTSASTLGGPNYGELVVHLKPRSERKLLVNDIIADLRPQLSNFPGMRVYLQNPPTIRIGGQVTKSLYQFSMQSPDKNELYAGATKLQNEIEKLPEVEDVTSDLAILAPQVNVTIDRDKAAALQVNADAIENAFYDAYGPRWVSTIYAAINEYKVLLELKPQYQADPHALSLLYFKSSTGPLIPLDTLAKLHQDTGPQTINH